MSRYHTAPSRLRKRDSNVWDDLNAIIDAVDRPQHGLHAATLSGLPDTIQARTSDGGSWSRQSKRRTSEQGSAMNLWEVSEALSVAAAQPAAIGEDVLPLGDLDALVAAEESEMAADPVGDMFDTQRFVESVFAVDDPAGVPELALAPTETTEASEDELQQDELLAMLRTEAHEWDLDRHVPLEGPESPSPTSVTALFGAALSGDGSPLEEVCNEAGARSYYADAFHAVLTQKLGDCAARPATHEGGTQLPGTLAAFARPLSSQSGSSRNGAERKEWTAAEDEIIHSSVLIHGCKWRRIAALLPGRSDDAVRNRWNRLKEQTTSSPPIGAMPPPVAKRVISTSNDSAGKPERVSWTKAEDATILSSVQELGHKWNKLAERLPGRTDHAIRNRFHRLQTMLEDKQREQQRELAPLEPLSPVANFWLN